MSKRSRQLRLDLRPPRRWGGSRRGAGRKPGPSPRDPHRRRPPLAGRFPCHVTLKVRRDVPSLRIARFVRELERSWRRACERGRFRVAHIDPASSGRWFDGWSVLPSAPGPDLPAVAPPRTWLLRQGWRRHGLLRPDEVPGR